jgi:hypothetical protein
VRGQSEKYVSAKGSLLPSEQGLCPCWARLLLVGEYQWIKENILLFNVKNLCKSNKMSNFVVSKVGVI